MKTGRSKEKISMENKFWSFVDKKDTNNCWEWKGILYKQGYGRFYHHSTSERKAHRISFIIHFGEILKEVVICHRCNNRKCVNPNHLYSGTHMDNMKDLQNSNILKGENNPASKLTEDIILKIRNEYKSKKISMYSMANKYDVSQTLISKIICGYVWKHVGGPIGLSTINEITPFQIEQIKKLRKEGKNIKKIGTIIHMSGERIGNILRKENLF